MSDITTSRGHGPSSNSLETIGLLATGIAHDLKNLLGVILSDTELVLANLPRECACRGELERIRSVAIRGSEIVSELMVYAGEDKANLEPVDLSLVVGDMLSLLETSITKQAMLTTDLVGGLPPVIAEAAELRQIVMNLILNASEALGAETGEIHVATSCVTNPEPGTSALPPGDYLRLDVSDTGCGMPPEAQDRMLDPFFTTKPSGRGLGLTVAQRIVRKYGGSIQCTSAKGEGTHFVVLLPCVSRAGQDSRARSASPSVPAPARGGTLLIVDDEEGIRVPISNLLRRRGFRVLEAPDGSAALELLQRDIGAVDVILLDLTLPGMPSRQIIAEAARIQPEIKVVLTSAYSSETAALASEAPQVRWFIRKPYELHQLTSLLSEVLSASPAETLRTPAAY